MKLQKKTMTLLQYVLPAFSHTLTFDPPSGNCLKEVDRDIKIVVKKFLHLHSMTTNFYFMPGRGMVVWAFPSFNTLS